MIGGQLEVFFENEQLVPAVFIQADLSNPQHIGLGEEFRDESDDIFCEVGIF